MRLGTFSVSKRVSPIPTTDKGFSLSWFLLKWGNRMLVCCAQSQNGLDTYLIYRVGFWHGRI